MAPAEFARLMTLFAALFGGWLCLIGAWLPGLWFICGAAFVAYHVNYNP